VRKKKKRLKLPLGITLVEVLACIVIFGVIMLIAAPNFKSQLNHVKEKADGGNIQLIEGAIKQFRLDTGILPGDLQYLLANPPGGIPGWAGPYVVSIPQSPSGRSYEIDPNTGRVILR